MYGESAYSRSYTHVRTRPASLGTRGKVGGEGGDDGRALLGACCLELLGVRSLAECTRLQPHTYTRARTEDARSMSAHVRAVVRECSARTLVRVCVLAHPLICYPCYVTHPPSESGQEEEG